MGQPAVATAQTPQAPKPAVGSPFKPPSTPTATPLDAVTVDETAFEGTDVGETMLSLRGVAQMHPKSARGNPEERVVTVGDILTVQLDVRCSSISFEADTKSGVIRRIQHVRPIPQTDCVIADVVRLHRSFAVKSTPTP